MNSVNATFIKIMGIAILSLGLYACGGGNGDLPSTSTDIPLPSAPGTGSTDTGSTDTGSTDTGSTDTGNIESSSGPGVATINWTPPTENTDGTTLGDDLAGYKIYYGTTPDSLYDNILINNPGLTSYVIDNLESNTTYYFSVTAVNRQGIESPFSNIVSKQVSG